MDPVSGRGVIDYSLHYSLQSQCLVAPPLNLTPLRLIDASSRCDRRLNGLALLGVPMDGRALINIMAAVIPLFSAMYYLSRLINYAS